ncbi:MAG: RuBisCO large subunit C-terminal-like domain-containing protein [Candidatus Scalindua sp.]
MKYPEAENERFTVQYIITTNDERSIEEHASDITLEQTVEVPEDCIPENHFEDGIIGIVEDIQPNGNIPNQYITSISYRTDITELSIPQFFNVLFGNISLKNNIKISDITFSDSFFSVFNGPNYGIAGVRKLLGVYGRALACSALKPMGLQIKELSKMAGLLAKGGIDLIKDDHGISNQKFHPFKERVSSCQEAVDKVNAGRDRKTLYFPMVSGRFEDIEEQVQHVLREGIRGILIAPMLVGPDTVRYIAGKYNLIIMAHPALTGTHFHDPNHGIAPSVFLGTLFRMLGADISIFPHAGGRFHLTVKECLAISNSLRNTNGSWKSSFPCPAGGIHMNRISEINELYGVDTIFLIGGSLMQHSTDISHSTEVFMEKIKSLYNEKLCLPEEPLISSCEIPSEPEQVIHQSILKCEDFKWSGRFVEEYKTDNNFDFSGISRQELFGKSGEKTSFDLRYFEIEPEGYSSLEKHVHEHVIIGVRGNGVLIKEDSSFNISVHDIAYVSPLEKHQLRNEGKEPFGFFCIVDHKRDKPIVTN